MAPQGRFGAAAAGAGVAGLAAALVAFCCAGAAGGVAWRCVTFEEMGFISGYAARLDARQVGLGVIAFIHVTMARGHIGELPKFQDLVADLPQILECYSVTGDFDYVIKVVARDLHSLSQFLMDTLMHMPGVSAVRSSVCLNEVKCTTTLPLN